MLQQTKTPGQVAYEEDVRRWPAYHDGTPRASWADLDDLTRWSWDRNPTPRTYTKAQTETSYARLAEYRRTGERISLVGFPVR